MLITSKSHQVEKVRGKGDVLPSVDRYRIIVPVTQALSINKDEYRLATVELADKLGLEKYSDPKALKDIVRQYYKSPVDAQVIVNNTKKAFDSVPINEYAAKSLKALEARKLEAREQILSLSKITNTEFNNDHSAYPKIINLDAINRLPLPEIYQLMTSQELKLDGSYLMGKGVTANTSASRDSFTVFESDDNWIWHDFKSNESGNVITFLKEFGLDAFKASEMLSKHFNIELMTDNPSYYEKVLKTALTDSHNDKTLENSIKEKTGANYVKLDGNELHIADKQFTLDELNITKGEIISSLQKNRQQQPSSKPSGTNFTF